MRRVNRRTILGAGASAGALALAGAVAGEEHEDDAAGAKSDANGEATQNGGAGDAAAGYPDTPLNGDAEQVGDLALSSQAFADGERMPDFVGFVNANENPPLEIGGVPDGTESLVLVFDDPTAREVVGHTFDHWLVWNIDPGIGEIPRGWDGGDAVQGYNDFGQQGYDGPSPPAGTNSYRWKLFAIDSTLDQPPVIRKTRLGGVIATEAEALGATQLVGEYSAEQGTMF